MRSKTIIWAVLAIGISHMNVSAQSATAARQQEQPLFGLEEDVKLPAEIPQSVLQQLRKDEDTLLCFQDDGPREPFSPAWYQASAIRLNPNGPSDLVVVAKNPCMWGANIGPFWVFKKIGSRYALVLKANVAGLEILRSKTNGVRDIKVYSHSAVEIYTTLCKFNGKKYKTFSRKVSAIGSGS